MLKQPNKKSHDRVKPKKATPVYISSASASGTVLTLTFDQTVGLKGTPQYVTDVPNAKPVSAEMTSPVMMRLTFDTDITTASELTIPFEDPAVKNPVGGFVADSTYPLSAAA